MRGPAGGSSALSILLLPVFYCAVLSSAETGYVGSKACAGCHARLYSDYLKSAMGRSVVPAQDTKNLAPTTGSIKVRNGALTYEVWRRGDEIFQSESEADAAGNEIFRTAHRLEYAIGSGVNGLTYAVRRGNYLFQAPLSYFSRAGTWQLSPGYERDNPGFNRPIAEGCIACHSGRANTVPEREGLYNDPPFAEMAVGCENCHGPGARHVRERTRLSIVNPARLPLRLADDICMNCHQAGDTRVPQPGKTYSDFRPGTHLSDTVAIFKIPLSPAGDSPSPLLEHDFSMRISRCFLESKQRMSCRTCHNPHSIPPTQAAPAYYEKKCLACHTPASCKANPAQRAHEPTGCIGCHMPKSGAGFISHSALTNHRIVVRGGEPLPAAAYRQTTPELPDLIYLNRSGDRPVPPIVLLQAYGELADRAPVYKDRYLQALDAFAARTDTSPIVEAALGRKAMRDGLPNANGRAIEHLSKAVQAGFTGPAAFEDLAAALAAHGRTEEAIAVLKKGLDLSPYAPRLHKFLAVQYINTKQYEEARSVMRHYLELFPEDNFVRDLLKKVGR